MIRGGARGSRVPGQLPPSPLKNNQMPHCFELISITLYTQYTLSWVLFRVDISTLSLRVTSNMSNIIMRIEVKHKLRVTNEKGEQSYKTILPFGCLHFRFYIINLFIFFL